MSYNTKQKDLILEIIRNEKKEFTVKDIYEKLENKVGLTTIYRLIDNMISTGDLTKTISKDNITYYQYLEHCDHDNHFYLKCNNCGEMIHIDCDCINELTNHIYKEHKFISDKDNIIINGLCSKCRR